MEIDGMFRVRAEVILLLMRRFSISEEDVISELSLIVHEFIFIPTPDCKYNGRFWNTRKFKTHFRDQELFISISKHKHEGFICVRVSVPNYTTDRRFDLSTFKERGKTYARDQLEKALEIF